MHRTSYEERPRLLPLEALVRCIVLIFLFKGTDTFAVSCFDLDESKGFGAGTVRVSANAGSNGVLLLTLF